MKRAKIKPRNPFVVPLMFRKGKGKHKGKAKTRSELNKEWKKEDV